MERKLTRIIINADDCGMSSSVNKEIENCILNHKISSTTIMANMYDFEGAVRLFQSYNDVVSFGWHVNLTEGEPLLKSQLLLDKGYYIEDDGRCFFNGKAYWKRNISPLMISEINKELQAQFEKLSDYGIRISHVDSHQHIHTSPGLFWHFPKLIKDLNIKRCRRIRNNMTVFYSRFLREVWTIPYRFSGIGLTDSFCSFRDFHFIKDLKHGATVELMVHPGHQGQQYRDEYELLKNTDVESKGCELITYREL